MIVNTGAALARSFVTHRTRLLHAAQKILRCRLRAEDIVQDAFLKVAEHAGRDAVASPAAYLLSVVRNLAIDQYRRSALEYRLFTREEHAWEIATPSQAVESSLWSAQCLEVIERAVAQLPERTRVAFEMHRVQGLTQRDIAKRLSISATLVNFMICDAMDHCRRALERLERNTCDSAPQMQVA
jgi:RNA polymerase sigma-70 factor (ECF subfamily)